MKIGRREGRDRSGTAAVEMAMVLPLFFALLLGTVEFARFGMAMQLLTTAAREGCRVASLPKTTEDDVNARVTAILKDSGIPVPQAVPYSDSGDWTTTPHGEQISLTLTVPYKDISWLSNANPLDMINRLLGDGSTLDKTNVTASAVFCSERP